MGYYVRLTRIFLAVLAVTCADVAIGNFTASSANMPTLDDFLRDTEVRDIAMSPDGKKLAMVKRVKAGRYRLYTLDIEDDYKVLSTRSEPFLQYFSGVQWLNNDRMGVSLGVSLLINGYSIGLPNMFIQSADGSNYLDLSDEGTGVGKKHRLGQVASVLPNDPENIMMIAYGPSVDLYKVNVETGVASRVAKGGARTVAFRVNERGEPVLRIDFAWRSKKVTLYSYNQEKNKWVREIRFRLSDMENELSKKLANFEGDTTILLLDRVEGDEFVKLHQYDIKTREYGDVVHEVKDYDVWNTLEHSYTGETMGVIYVDERPRYEYFDEDFQRVQDYLESQLQNGQVQIVNVSDDKRRFLIFYSEPWRRGVYLLYDDALGSLREIVDVAPQIEKASTTSVDVFRYKAKDETMIQAYLTFPADRVGDALPLIVFPHGGPHARDWLSYSDFTQYWATRGYAVFQPNFRGSTGYGRAFQDAGNGELGGEMIEDIASGVRALAKAGRIDPARVCAAGVSYGGYAAMMLAVKTDLLSCAISINAPVDYERQIKEDLKATKDREERVELREWFDETIGNIDTGKEKLRTQSLLYRAAEINVPLLLIHAKDDDTVDFGNARALNRSLKKVKKRDFEFFELENGGHSLSWDDATKKVLKKTEAFFFEHIGGDDIVPLPKDKSGKKTK